MSQNASRDRRLACGYVRGNPISRIDPLGLVDRGGSIFEGSLENDSTIPVPVIDSDNGTVELVPPGETSTSGIDFDFAWINCKCWKIGPGELDIGTDGMPKIGQLRHGPAPEKFCRKMAKPEQCKDCTK